MVVPLVKGGIITITTLRFMFVWNIFIFPLVLSGYQSKTLPVLVYSFLVDDALDFGPMSAAAVLITLAGCALPVRRIVSFRPFEVLHGL